MKKRKVNSLALAVAGVFAITSLVGCGQKTNNEDLNEKYAGAEVILNGDEIYPVKCDDTLTYWMGAGSEWTHKFENYGDTPMAKKLSEDTGISVKYVHPTSGGGKEQFQLMLASDELPDIVEHNWNTYPGGPDMAIGENYIMKLNNLISKFAPGLTSVLENHPDWDKEIKTDSGAYYAFPFFLDGRLLQVAQGPVLRADWLKELNLSVPETIDEWESVLTAFKEKKNVESPFISQPKDTLKTFCSAFNVYPDWYQDGGSVKYGPMEPGYKDLIIKLNDWYQKGLIDKDIATIDSKAVINRMVTGKGGSAIAWAGSGVGQWLSANPDRSTYDLVGTQYPSTVKGENAEYTPLTKPVSLSYCAAINSKCVNPELATRLLDYGFTEAGHNLMNFGIEGESYNWVDGYPKYTDLILKNPDGLTISQAMGLYLRAGTSGIMAQDQRYIEQYYQLSQQKDAQKVWAKTNMDAHLLPELYLQSDEKDRDSEVMANIKTYVDEQTLRFIIGANPIEKYDEFVAQLKTFGIEEAIAYRQSALERYNNR